MCVESGLVSIQHTFTVQLVELLRESSSYDGCGSTHSFLRTNGNPSNADPQHEFDYEIKGTFSIGFWQKLKNPLNRDVGVVVMVRGSVEWSDTGAGENKGSNNRFHSIPSNPNILLAIKRDIRMS